MTTHGRTPIHQWADALEAHAESLETDLVTRVAVLASTASTQDAASRMAAGQPGLLLITGHQTTGRGRLGRGWLDSPDHSLAMTLALSAHAHDAPALALAAGVAIADACAESLAEDTLGLKWPNDVVERRTARKLAGVLIETVGPIALVGIGVNVSHPREALDADGLLTATSLRDLGSDADRLDTAKALLTNLSLAVRAPEAELLEAWRRRDTLTGTHHAFVHDGQRYEGVVESIDPTLTLVVRTRDGIQRLPALTTAVDPDP
ncbi:MAG: biotin--[acetyl-CoA-carboxylase] ligase [Planctomycetota bacterium]